MEKIILSLLFLSSVLVWSSCTPPSPSPQPATPAAVDVINFMADAGSGQVVLGWTIPSNADAAEFDLTYSPGGATPIVIQNNQTAYTVTGLTGGTAYTFTLKNKNSAGNFSSGATATATPTAVVAQSMTATSVNGSPWASTTINGITNAGVAVISSTQASDASGITLTMLSTSKANYTVDGTLNNIIYAKGSGTSTVYTAKSGSINVLDNTNGVLTADFNASLTNNSNASDVITITGGHFVVKF